MATTVFYSWQSDLPNRTNRGFIEECLQRAIKEVKARSDVKLDPCFDRDTQNVPGSPDIAATIFDKIDNASVVVCDVSIIQDQKRPSPNPNVLLELGYAVKALGWERVICLINEHFGSREDLPFDLRQRRVRSYKLSPDATDKSDTRTLLVKLLQQELASILSAPSQPAENLLLQFGDVATRMPRGSELLLSSTSVPMRDKSEIADYEPEPVKGPFGTYYLPTLGLTHDNRDYHREMADYLRLSMLLQPVGLVIFNGNQHPLTDVRLEAEFEKSYRLEIRDKMPLRPSTRSTDNITRSIRPVWDRFEKPGDVKIDDLGSCYHVSIFFGKLHAEANAWSNLFYVGADESGEMICPCRIYADQLTSPMEVKLRIQFNVAIKTLEELDGETFQKLME